LPDDAAGGAGVLVTAFGGELVAFDDGVALGAAGFAQDDEEGHDCGQHGAEEGDAGGGIADSGAKEHGDKTDGDGDAANGF